MFKILHIYTNTFIDYNVSRTTKMATDDFNKLLQVASMREMYLVTVGSNTYVKTIASMRALLQEHPSEEFKIRALHPSHLKLVEVDDV